MKQSFEIFVTALIIVSGMVFIAKYGDQYFVSTHAILEVIRK